MPVQTSYPGVYIEEKPSGVRTITGVSTSVALFIGPSIWGPIDVPTLCLSYEDFRRKFTDDNSKGELNRQVQAFFDNGGSECFVVRVFNANGAQTKAEVNLTNSTNANTILSQAKYKGALGQTLKVTVDYNDTTPDSFNLNIYRKIRRNVAGNEVDIDLLVESWLGVSIEPQKPKYIEDYVKSDWISFGSPSAGRPKADSFELTGGATGTVLDGITYTNVFPIILREINLFNLMILPKVEGFDVHSIRSQASSFCKENRAFLLLDPPDNWNGDVQTATSGIAGLRIGVVLDYSAVFFPKLIKLEGNEEIKIGPSGAIAGLMARIDSARGVWKAPAGIETSLRGIKGVEYKFSDSENGRLNPRGVNTIRVFPTGIVNWGARTMDGDDDFASEWKYIPVRRLALYIEESLYRGLKWVVFEPNDEPLWAQIRLNVTSFMDGLFKQGAFQGTTRKDAYLVKCDIETTTQNDINLGRVNILVGFAPLKPAEFVIIQLTQLAGQTEV